METCCRWFRESHRCLLSVSPSQLVLYVLIRDYEFFIILKCRQVLYLRFKRRSRVPCEVKIVEKTQSKITVGHLFTKSTIPMAMKQVKIRKKKKKVSPFHFRSLKQVYGFTRTSRRSDQTPVYNHVIISRGQCPSAVTGYWSIHTTGTRFDLKSFSLSLPDSEYYLFYFSSTKRFPSGSPVNTLNFTTVNNHINVL